MFARVTTFSLTADAYEKVMDIVSSTIEPKLRDIDGLITAVTTYQRESHTGQSVAIYRDTEAAEAAQTTIAEVWGSIAEHMAGPPATEVCDVVLHLTGGK